MQQNLLLMIVATVGGLLGVYSNSTVTFIIFLFTLSMYKHNAKKNGEKLAEPFFFQFDCFRGVDGGL